LSDEGTAGIGSSSVRRTRSSLGTFEARFGARAPEGGAVFSFAGLAAAFVREDGVSAGLAFVREDCFGAGLEAVARRVRFLGGADFRA
jgi:hypothetical protein